MVMKANEIAMMYSSNEFRILLIIRIESV